MLISTVLFVAALPLLMTMRVSSLAFVLGVTLPIGFLPGVPAIALDLARFSLAGLVVLRVYRPPEDQRGLVRGWAWILTATGSFWSIVLFTKDLPASSGLTMAFGAALAYLLATRERVGPSLLNGYVAGASASAAWAILQWQGLASGSDRWDLRFTGLSTTSTLLGLELSVAVAVLLFSSSWSRRPSSNAVRFFLITVVILAILVCGTRAALLASALLVAASAIRAVKNPPALILVSAATALSTLSVIPLDWGQFNSIRRLVGGDSQSFVTSLGSSRGERNNGALQLLLENPTLGVSREALVTGGVATNPHQFPLVLGVQTGLVGAVLGLLLVCATLFTLLFAWLRKGSPLSVSILALASFYSFVEPTGFFVGLSRTTLLLVAMALMHPGTTTRVRADLAPTQLVRARSFPGKPRPLSSPATLRDCCANG